MATSQFRILSEFNPDEEPKKDVSKAFEPLLNCKVCSRKQRSCSFVEFKCSIYLCRLSNLCAPNTPKLRTLTKILQYFRNILSQTRSSSRKHLISIINSKILLNRLLNTTQPSTSLQLVISGNVWRKLCITLLSIDLVGMLCNSIFWQSLTSLIAR